MLADLAGPARGPRADRLRGARRRRLRHRDLGPDRRRRQRGDLRALIKSSMAPVWEANHVWLIFILVVMWTAFPVAFGSIASTLAVPLFLAAVGIILRGTAFALRGEAASMCEQRALGGIFALSSLLVPFFLGAVVGGIASGGSGGQRRRRRADELVEPDVDHGRRAGGRDRRPPGGRVPRGRRPPGGADRAGARLARARAGLGRGGRGDGPGRAARGALGRARPLRRAHAGVGLACVLVSGAAGLATLALVWRGRFAAARYSAARCGGGDRGRAGGVRRSPTCSHPSSRSRRRRRPMPRWWRCSAGPRSASAS